MIERSLHSVEGGSNLRHSEHGQAQRQGGAQPRDLFGLSLAPGVEPRVIRPGPTLGTCRVSLRPASVAACSGAWQRCFARASLGEPRMVAAWGSRQVEVERTRSHVQQRQDRVGVDHAVSAVTVKAAGGARFACTISIVGCVR